MNSCEVDQGRSAIPHRGKLGRSAPRGDDPQTIGWNSLRGSWKKIIPFVAIIGGLAYFKPPLPVTYVVINAWIITQSLIEKRFSWKGIIVLNVLITAFVLTYKYVGGWTAIIITHIVGGGLIIYGNWSMIKKAHYQIQGVAKGINHRRNKSWDQRKSQPEKNL